MPDKRTHAGALDATTGRTHPPPLTEGHEMPHMPHIEDRIADGHIISGRTRWILGVAANLLLNKIAVCTSDAVATAVDIMIRCEEIDRHERLRYPKPAPEPLPPQRPAYRK